MCVLRPICEAPGFSHGCLWGVPLLPTPTRLLPDTRWPTPAAVGTIRPDLCRGGVRVNLRPASKQRAPLVSCVSAGVTYVEMVEDGLPALKVGREIAP